MSHYSHSRLELYEGCPLAYKLRYKDKRREQPSEALETGSEVHDWIAAYTRHLLAKGLSTDLDWIRGTNAAPEVKEILDVFGDTHVLEPGDYVLEEMWRFPLGPHTWWGVIDRLMKREGIVDITDYKTDHKVRSQSEVDRDPQLRRYAWMAAQKYSDAETFICRIDFVRHGVTREVTYYPDDIPGIEDEILSAIARIEEDAEFKARPGTRCAWCSWTASCPAIAAGDLEVIKSADDAERTASQLVALKARVGALEEMLKPWCTREGPIPVNGMIVGYSTSHTTSYKVSDLVHVADRHGLDPMSLLTPDSRAVKAVAKRDPDFAVDLEEIALDNSTSRFGIKKEAA